jgi:hypothetical protein
MGLTGVVLVGCAYEQKSVGRGFEVGWKDFMI